ncbi:acetolactate decarboxylase [Muricauda ruestringensis]|uniref:Alpha-acetolactate decarboxylase n=2 Tax=Flagellimonas aurea TaxID=2915619 RepID=A0ABS3G9F7_9FLAO|nr:acetolactate decarboxylase [Allomuricauda aurea]
MLHNRLLVSPLSQIENEKKSNTLYNYGVIDGFIGGLYEGSLPIKSLYLNGDFGLGAPDMLDGELTMLDGQAYQTNSTGETKKLPNDHKTSFASVTFFAPENILVQDGQQDKAATLDYIVSRLSNKNGMYAIQISGSFKYIKTRAFPPVDKKPHPKLSDILDRQEFFEYRDIDGTLVGFLLPDYLNGINASGFHFHFLSEDRKSGGHILEFIGQNLKIEIDELQDFKLDVPFDANFKNYNFSKKDNEALEKVEKGKE